MEITKIDKIRRFKSRGYVLMDAWTTFDDNESIPLKSSYSWPELQYIGDKKIAYLLWNKYGINEFYPNEKYTPADIKKLNKKEKTKNSLRYSHEFIPFLRNAKVCSIGWSPSQQKWYGWSHRAIHGFTIGSEVKKNSPAFVPSNKEDLIDDMLDFWDLKKDGSWSAISDSYMKRLVGYKEIEEQGQLGIEITNEVHFFGRQKGRKNEIKTLFEAYPKWGKGEWKAETLEDAKQMAIDFAEGVS